MITEQCLFCGATFKVPDEYAGKKVKCPRCKEAIGISQRRPEPAATTEKADGDSQTVFPIFAPKRVSDAVTHVVVILGWAALALGTLGAVASLLILPRALPDLLGGLLQTLLALGFALASVLAGGLFCAVCILVSQALRTLADMRDKLDELVKQNDILIDLIRKSGSRKAE
jgi:phage FluMu protein Com